MAKQDSRLIRFNSFDPHAEVDRSARNLPHWFQTGVATFLTFRTADSMPKQVVDDWQKELRTWLTQHDFELAIAERPEWECAIPLRLRKQYRKLKRQGWLNRLDECHGDCVLRQPELSMLVAKTLLHFEGDRYDTDCLVVMPNHVHLIVQFRPGTLLAKQTRSWLQYSARELNQRLSRQGKFWQSEPFDHLIRSEEQFHYLRRYIAENPVKAGLRVGEYLYWNRAEGFQ